ncbi:hypothetical protein CDD82_6691 [Ophiocordyceps australis]|uniref:Structure-specific endonuclease subunit SLX4 n=1 Tax=Ophiocordyceps australis TaxID=1399860 RepID=A0A2C5ZS01_9HYPO|nr:hypothetical protein CDD82_6691 [Ophiocordyceps australis]
MATPDAFLSSPARGARNPSLAALTSSPDLPSLHELLARKPNPPALKSGSNAAPIPQNATAAFSSAGTLYRSLYQNYAAPNTVLEVPGSIDAPVAQDEGSKKTTRSEKSAKNPGQKTPPGPDVEKQCSPLSKDQPWKRFKSPSIAKDDTAAEPHQSAGAIIVSSSPFSQVVRSHYFQTPETPTRTRTKVPQHKVQNEPLNLEPATSRRLSWTPPVPGSVVILDSDDGPADAQGSGGSRQGHAVPQQTFGSILAPFRRCQDLQQPTLVVPDESSATGKKRKSIEPAPSTGAHAPRSPRAPSKPPRKKAVRKNPQTVTGLATAAYRAPIQVDDGCQENALAQVVDKIAKDQPRKRTTKPRKKKEVLPAKPMLLSPAAALRQVAQQDFIFGTSSQLVREQSPSLPRNLEASRRPSSQLDQGDLETPINSDALEQLERRQTLWDAGARDEDGELFDFQLHNMPDCSLQRTQESDPFGYMRGHDGAVLLPQLPAHGNSDGEDPLLPVPKLSVAPRSSPRREATKVHKTCSAEHPLTLTEVGADSEELAEPCMAAKANQDKALDAAPQTIPRVATSAPSGSSYDLLSDAQLAKQVADYGFKPIKRRTAMIALLEQCRQGKGGTTQQGIRLASVLTKNMPKVASRAKSDSDRTEAKIKEKKTKICKAKTKQVKMAETIGRLPIKPRGDDEGIIQEPPPSAQPMAGPEGPGRSGLECSAPETRKKRGPGRPRKSSAVQDGEVQEQVRAHQQWETRNVKKRAGRGRRHATPSPPPKTRPTARSKGHRLSSLEDEFDEMLELDFDHGKDSAGSSSWSESGFSESGPCDLSLTMDEDTTLLQQSPSEQQATLFRYMAKAVASAARTRDAANPSWHDKILLYDPIVIEDLAAWLNSGQLTRVGYDDEVSLEEVKKWCESKSICCLWRLNLRRQERRRF